MSWSTGNYNNNQRSGVEIIRSNLEYIKEGVYEALFSPLYWYKLIPEASIDTAASPGDTFASYIHRNRTGSGAFRARGVASSTQIGFTQDKKSVPLQPASVGTVFDRQDQLQWEKTQNVSLMTEIGQAMSEAYNRHIEGVFFFGDTAQNYIGLLNDPYIETQTAALNEAGTSTEWVNKSSAEIIFDIESALGYVYQNTGGLFTPDTVLIPLAQQAQITGQQASNLATENIYSYVSNKNIYSAQKGKPLTIMGVPYLKGAGAGGTDRMRLMVLNDPRQLWMPFPEFLNILPPVQINPFTTEIDAAYCFGPVTSPYPVAQLNVDGI